VKVGDYVGKITNPWTQHNRWMKFPDDELEPLGIIVGVNPLTPRVWCVLCNNGTLVDICSSQVEVIHESR